MTEFEQQQQELLRQRQRFAEMSQAQAPQGRMVGRTFVAPNALEYLAAGLRGIGGMKGEAQVGQQMRELETQRAGATQKALADFLRQSQGQAAITLPEDQAGPVLPAQAPDMRAAYGALLQSPDAGLRQMAMQGMAQLPQLEQQRQDRDLDRQMKIQENEDRRKARIQELELQHQQRMEYLRQNNADRAAMAEAQRQFQASIVQANREFQRSVTGAVAGQKPPQGYRFTPDGNLEAIPGGPAANKDGQKPLTESQAKGTLYLGQMRSATEELDKLPSVSPVRVAATGSTYTNWAAGKDAQKVGQLQNQWAEAYLRAKTGAAATAQEVDLNRRTFFPVVGDTPEVIKQKRVMREQAERDMEPTAGPGAAGAGRRAAPQLSPQDQQALDWANSNPNDPRSAEIKKRLQGR